MIALAQKRAPPAMGGRSEPHRPGHAWRLTENSYAQGGEKTPRDAAIAYATDLGWHLFPVAADCRAPLVGGGCHAATSEGNQLSAWFSDGANVSLATGNRSGVFALDIDVKHVDGLETLAVLEDENGWLPETWESETPSGGRHLFFRQPERALRNRVNFAPGLDVRTTGGSVALPPSRKHQGPYRWRRSPWSVSLADAPHWLLNIIDPPALARVPAAQFRPASLDRAALYVAAIVESECEAVAQVPRNAGRNHRLFIAAARLGELVAGGALHQSVAEGALEHAAHDNGLVREDGRRMVMATITSGLKRGMESPRSVEVGQ